jgi:hypothetical protein
MRVCLKYESRYWGGGGAEILRDFYQVDRKKRYFRYMFYEISLNFEEPRYLLYTRVTKFHEKFVFSLNRILNVHTASVVHKFCTHVISPDFPPSSHNTVLYNRMSKREKNVFA